MYLIRRADGSKSVFSVIALSVSRSENGSNHKAFVVRGIEPHAWRWSGRYGSGASAIGRTQQEAELLLRELA